MRRKKSSTVFNLAREGTLGVFALQDQPDRVIFYLSTSFAVSELEYLKLARDVLADEVVDFEMMIQRDIVPQHAERIEQYLKTPRAEPKFFPPLLAALVQVEHNRLLEWYPQPSVTLPAAGTMAENPILRLNWGKAFTCEIGLPLEDDESQEVPLPLAGMGSQAPDAVNVIPSLAVLKVNTTNTEIVVVDGQHRLSAIRRVYKDPRTARSLANMSVPVCILWPPFSFKSDDARPDVLKVLRRVFLDVNGTVKQVSGHFRILLDDERLERIAIRSTCELLRKDGLLRFVEWNQHEEKRSRQLSLYSKTTSVGIMEAALEKPSAARLGLTRDNYLPRRVFPYLLQLHSVRAKLEAADSSASFEQLNWWDTAPSEAIRAILREQIDEHFVPAFAHLLMQSPPFVKQREVIAAACEEFCISGEPECMEAERSLINMSEPATDNVRAARNELHGQLRKRLEELEGWNTPIYRTQRFQQGLLGAFMAFANRFVSAALDLRAPPKELATVFVRYLSTAVFRDDQDKLFAESAPWLDSVVTVTGTSAIIRAQSTSVAVGRLLLAPLGREAVAKSVVRDLGLEDETDDTFVALQKALVGLGDDLASAYWDSYVSAIKNRLLKSLETDGALDAKVRSRLIALKEKLEGAGSEEDDSEAAAQTRSELLREIDVAVAERTATAAKKYRRVLGYSFGRGPRRLARVSVLVTGADPDDDDDDDEGHDD